MAYADIQMFMEKLKQLIYCNDIPFINNPSILCERPQFQLLYQELGSMIQTLFIDQHQNLHGLKKVDDLKKRFISAAEEAQYIVDVFLSGVHNNGRSLHLDDVSRSFNSVKVELASLIIDSMKLGSSQGPEQTLNQPAPAPICVFSDSLRSKKLLDEVFVGIDRDAELIRDKLVEDQKKVDVVSIVGMGGIGKTTLATKVFNDGYVKYHFDVRVWVTVSQTYNKRAVLTQIVESMGVKLDLEKDSNWQLHGLVYKRLMGKRYLIVIDDIWNIETWDSLKSIFPHGNTGSRILLTSRLIEVAKHANSYGFIHHLGYLNKEKSWELLCKKVFHHNECPEWSIKPGMQIVEKCQGLPLAVVVIAGILAKHAWSEKFWVEIAYKVRSYIVGDQKGCIETLALSYNHLPPYLKECFLYLGGFPEDYVFKVERLIWLWVAEGFVQQDGNRSLEDIAEGYLMDLIDRNLLIVKGRGNSNGEVKACKMHDLVREVCLKKAKEDGFNILQTEKLPWPPCFSNFITPPYKPVRLFVNKYTVSSWFSNQDAPSLRSTLWSSDFPLETDDIAKCLLSFAIIRVLDLQKSKLKNFPKGMETLVHLRYLAIWMSSKVGFPSEICNLWNLQTLIYIRNKYCQIVLPSNISDLVNLRHLCSTRKNGRRIKVPFLFPCIEKPMSLQTVSSVELGDGVDNFRMCFPYVKELTCPIYVNEKNNFKSLTFLEKLKLKGNLLRNMKSVLPLGMQSCGKNHITFPATLKSLVLLHGCCLPWSDMSIIQALPNLQVLKLGYYAFLGSCWSTDEQIFSQLKFLTLEGLDIKQWEACSTSFPCLKQLKVFFCDLEEIPLEIGDIPTLELIQIKKCRPSVGESVRRIQQAQHDWGNYDLKIGIF